MVGKGGNPSRLMRRLGQSLRLEPWQRTLYVIIVAEVVGLLGFGISIPFLPFYIQELGTTDLDQVALWVGIINSAAPITMALAAPVWGVVADRYGRKPMLVRSLIGGALVLSLMAAVRSVPQLAFLRIIQGTLSGSVAAATTMVAATVPRERSGFALGLLQTAIFAGNSLGPFVGGAVGGTFGYKAAFIASGVLLLLAGTMVAFWTRENFTPAARQAKKSSHEPSAVRMILKEPLILTMLAALMLNSLGGMVTTPVLPLFVQTLVPDAKAASTATGMIVGATAMTNALAAVWVGRSADRLGRRRVLITCLAIGAVTYFPQMLVRSPGQLLVLRGIMGLGMGGVIPVANAVIAERAPAGRQGAIFGTSASLNAVGRAVGPMIGTLVVTNVALPAVFPVTGCMLVLVAVLIALATRNGPGMMSTSAGAGE